MGVGGETGLLCLNQGQTRLGDLVHTLYLHAGVRRDSPGFFWFFLDGIKNHVSFCVLFFFSFFHHYTNF